MKQAKNPVDYVCTVCGVLTTTVHNVRVGGAGGCLHDLCSTCLDALVQVQWIDRVEHKWDAGMNYVPEYTRIER